MIQKLLGSLVLGSAVFFAVVLLMVVVVLYELMVWCRKAQISPEELMRVRELQEMLPTLARKDWVVMTDGFVYKTVRANRKKIVLRNGGRKFRINLSRYAEVCRVGAFVRRIDPEHQNFVARYALQKNRTFFQDIIRLVRT